MHKKVTSLDQSVSDRWSFPRFLNFRNANVGFYFLPFFIPFQKTLNSQVFCACMGEEQLGNKSVFYVTFSRFVVKVLSAGRMQ